MLEQNGKNEKKCRFLMSNGCYVNTEQLLFRLCQSEDSRRETEQQFKLSQCQLGKDNTYKYFLMFLN